VRVVAGELRGRRLVAPEGLDVRPTPDKVREALFDILGLRIRGSAFLDLFAGSGAMGIEAVSRGAARVAFIESSPRALRILETNLRSLGIEERVVLYRTSWPGALRDAVRTGPYSLVFADPPFPAADYPGILESLAHPDLLVPEATIVLEHETKTPTPDEAHSFTRTRQARYGRITLSFYRVSV
jgi:16S rRNA (guanine(966)-N(2))-methyltransferase RsmD